MATLSKDTVQRLAVLRALSMWQKGAYGPVRLQKVLFFADKGNRPDWRLFTFKKWRLGQYSDEIAESLNALRDAGRVTSVYDGPSERIRALVPSAMRRSLTRFFRDYFWEWSEALDSAFNTWAYLTNDDIIQKAHDDPTYTKNDHGDVIFRSFDAACVEFQGLSDALAERIGDFVDPRLQRGMLARVSSCASRPVKREDWRHIYFGEPRKAAKAV